MTNDQDDICKLLKSKADAFWLLGEKVHVKYKNEHWARGIILEVKAEFFILDESLEGKSPVFFAEIIDIQKYTPKKEDI
jgi:hypothetical protein